MARYTKESLEHLKERIELIEVIESHVELKRAGATFKACCPFHEEKTPSFVLKRGDSHYHCFGCGAHGDAITFLMQYQKVSFQQAVEMLADRFQVPLEQEAGNSNETSHIVLKELLEKATRLFHFFLLHTDEGHEALEYLYKRGMTLDFIRRFQIGYAPKERGKLCKLLYAQGANDKLLLEVGLLSLDKNQRKRDFFSERITFPIRNAAGWTIGFSARKFDEKVFGGKYINTSETPLFKKSRVLFGLSESRKRIIKEKRALVVEGQLDALRLIDAGLDFTVAGQGTAFGEGQVNELIKLGVEQVLLAFDGDNAGQIAAEKVGDLFQQKGIEVFIVQMPIGSDPDLLLQEHGPDNFLKLIDQAGDYLSFLFKRASSSVDMQSPAAKSALIERLAEKVRKWDSSVMVHESLRKLARLAEVPEELIGVQAPLRLRSYIKRRGFVTPLAIDGDLVLEGDLLRWLIVMGEHQSALVDLVKANLKPEDFFQAECRDLFSFYLDLYREEKPRDLISIHLELSEEQRTFLDQLLEKKINIERVREHLMATISQLIERNWLFERDSLKEEIDTKKHNHNETIELLKRFDALTKNKPQVIIQ